MNWNRLAFEPLALAVHRQGRTLKELEKQMYVVSCRARRTGLTLTKAEDVAHWLGLHPMEIWGDEYRAVQPEVEDEGGTFCGRPLWYRGTGRANFYGDPDPLCVQFREWMAA